ncbi:integrase [Aureimonas ureilytica]|uniref:Integrase n=1 Tax=Aureimonas ureilytica TaxID=401562 RepID=A0A175RKP9_9HYPH|nr:phage integrase N-terminal domain-containing protein [Aureimonas ureilytica]KTR03359.1 integrase [Aureimonas ureilytica]
MDALAKSLKVMCEHNADGAFTTQDQRARGLSMIAHELRALGYQVPDARNLKPKHIEVLVRHWKAERLSGATIRNRMSWLRWAAEKVRKPNIIPRDNAALGIESRSTYRGQKATATPAAKLAALPDERMRLAVRLQMAFGLRLEESLKFRVSVADKGTLLTMQGSWCKGGRTRSMPVLIQQQRDLLDELHQVCGDGSLVPNGVKFVTYMRQMQREGLKAKIPSFHEHRRWHARWRFRTMAGVPCPADGGPLHDDLSPAERARLDAVRLEVSRELGHGRIDVTDAYLGFRWATKGGAK